MQILTKWLNERDFILFYFFIVHNLLSLNDWRFVEVCFSIVEVSFIYVLEWK